MRACLAFQKSLAEAERDLERTLAADSPAEIKAAEREAVKRQLLDLRETVACEEQKPRIDHAIELLAELDKSKGARDEFVKDVESLLDDIELDEMEGLEKVRSKSGSELLKRLELPVVLPVTSRGGGGNISGLSGDLGGRDGGAGPGLHRCCWLGIRRCQAIPQHDDLVHHEGPCRHCWVERNGEGGA